jgi:hypothetical protein
MIDLPCAVQMCGPQWVTSYAQDLHTVICADQLM